MLIISIFKVNLDILGKFIAEVEGLLVKVEIHIGKSQN